MYASYNYIQTQILEIIFVNGEILIDFGYGCYNLKI